MNTLILLCQAVLEFAGDHRSQQSLNFLCVNLADAVLVNSSMAILSLLRVFPTEMAEQLGRQACEMTEDANDATFILNQLSNYRGFKVPSTESKDGKKEGDPLNSGGRSDCATLSQIRCNATMTMFLLSREGKSADNDTEMVKFDMNDEEKACDGQHAAFSLEMVISFATLSRDPGESRNLQTEKFHYKLSNPFPHIHSYGTTNRECWRRLFSRSVLWGQRSN